MSLQRLSIFHLHQTADPHTMGFQCKDILLQMILITETMKMPMCLQVMFKVYCCSVEN